MVNFYYFNPVQRFQQIRTMAISDWNTSNSNRYYPFVTNYDAHKLNNDEILDARFFVVNPASADVKVWLAKAEYLSDSRIYTFKNSDNGVLEFRVPNSDTVQTVWSSNDDWNGYCVFGRY